MTEWPIDWQQVVDEAVRRRKAEGLSQQMLANLVGVSRPTIVAFERGEVRLRFDKVLPILTELGLFTSRAPTDPQAAFVRAAFKRWRDLVDPLPTDAAARFPHGYFTYAYHLVGDIDPVPMRALPALAEESVVHLTGWPPFWIPTKESIKPQLRDGVLECWFGSPASDRVFDDAAHSDFWRIAPDGRTYLQRGYQEDGRDILQPGTFLDLVLPIWRCGEVLLHAAKFARAMRAEGGGIEVEAHFTGLAGRELNSWAKPARLITSGYRSMTSQVRARISTSAERIDKSLAEIVHEMLSPLYARFGGFVLEMGLVEEELTLLRQGRR